MVYPTEDELDKLLRARIVKVKIVEDEHRLDSIVVQTEEGTYYYIAVSDIHSTPTLTFG